MVPGMYREWVLGRGGAVLWTRDAVAQGRVARVLPDGCIDLIWSQGRIMVAGPDTTARLAHTPAGVDYVALRFPPGRAPALLGVDADQLRDAQPDLDDLWPGHGRRLGERIADATDPRAALVRAVRDEAVRRGCRTDPLIHEIARRLGRGEAVERVAQAVGLSPRHLHRRSLAAFGYGAKTLSRVLRLGRAVSLARRGVALVEVAASSGYADQAHFAREVRALVGITPLQLLREWAQPNAAKRSIALPSGSSTVA
jgi:AraC-like DNA-binding protein